jgi:hypothetical protein
MLTQQMVIPGKPVPAARGKSRKAYGPALTKGRAIAEAATKLSG